jgi:hypothetical protein
MWLSQLFKFFADGCNAGANFFGIPTWYKYLVSTGRMKTVTDPHSGIISCDLDGGLKWAEGDLVLIFLGVLDICLRIAALVAVGYVIYGGISYITSEGSPDATKNAQSTIINALVGLIIAILATAIVSFVGNKIG